MVDQVLKLTLELDENEKYIPAQNVAVYPRNSLSQIQRILKYLKADPSEIFVAQSKEGLKFPKSITIKSLFLHFLDLNGPIKASTLKKLVKCDITLNQSHNFQTILKNKKAQKEYISLNKNIIDLIEEFKIDMDIHKFVKVCSSIKVKQMILSNCKPRYFTIASYLNDGTKSMNLILKAESYMMQGSLYESAN
jgi:sulfite reductase alpha subunit-like flavoprotein